MVAFGDDYVSKMTLKYKKQDDTGNYKCQRHFMINVKCKECNKEICRLCIFDSKEELEHYYNHFDSINLNEPYDLKIENNEISKMSEDPFYSKFNKILLSYEQSVSKTVYETDSYFEINNFKTFYYEYLNNTLTKNYFYINEIKKDFDLKAKRIIESQIMNLSEKKYILNRDYADFKQKIKSYLKEENVRQILNIKPFNFHSSSVKEIKPIDVYNFDSSYVKFCNKPTKKTEKSFFDETSIKKYLTYNDSSFFVYNNVYEFDYENSNLFEKSEKLDLNSINVIETVPIINFSNFLIIKVEIIEINDPFLQNYWKFYFGLEWSQKNDSILFESLFDDGELTEIKNIDLSKKNPYIFDPNCIKNSKLKKEEGSIYPEIISPKNFKGVYFQSNGRINKPNTFHGDYIKLIDRNLQKGDIVYFYLDTSSTLWVGLNEIDRSKYTLIQENFSWNKDIRFAIKSDLGFNDMDCNVEIFTL